MFYIHAPAQKKKFPGGAQAPAPGLPQAADPPGHPGSPVLCRVFRLLEICVIAGAFGSSRKPSLALAFLFWTFCERLLKRIQRNPQDPDPVQESAILITSLPQKQVKQPAYTSRGLHPAQRICLFFFDFGLDSAPGKTKAAAPPAKKPQKTPRTININFKINQSICNIRSPVFHIFFHCKASRPSVHILQQFSRHLYGIFFSLCHPQNVRTEFKKLSASA